MAVLEGFLLFSGATPFFMIVSERLLTAEQVAVLLQVRTARVYELAREGLIPTVRLGRQVRVSSSALENWIADGGQSLGNHCGTVKDQRTRSESGRNDR
jgi:putative molybdopterin biosynthesis protein